MFYTTLKNQECILSFLISKIMKQKGFLIFEYFLRLLIYVYF